MAIPVAFQKFKAAGVYRVVYDKSTVLNTDSEILRLVVGYSEKGDFNVPVYIANKQDFIEKFGGISKKLEKRGIWFHRLALQCLESGPILCLNLKKFNKEHVGAATIDTTVHMNDSVIDTVTTMDLKLEDIYDTSRFWKIEPEKLNDARAYDSERDIYSGHTMDQYINISTINTKKTSNSFFIRKASGTVVSGFNITVSDWYSNEPDGVPDILVNNKSNLVSDFFAEIYVFAGEFKAEQVLASSTLKNYFKCDEDGNLLLKDYVVNAYGDHVDTLDALYNDETSGAINHYVGCLIPNFVDKQGMVQSLDIIFNNDSDLHNMMMSFNEMNLDNGEANIDLSGYTKLSETDVKTIYENNYYTTVLGNSHAKVSYDCISFGNNIPKNETGDDYAYVKETCKNSVWSLSGPAYISAIDDEEYTFNLSALSAFSYETTIDENPITFVCDSHDDLVENLKKFNVAYTKDGFDGPTYARTTGNPGWDKEHNYTYGNISEFISGISKISYDEDGNYIFKPTSSVVTRQIEIVPTSETVDEYVYNNSLSFIDATGVEATTTINPVTGMYELKSDSSALLTLLQGGDRLLSSDDAVDIDPDEDGLQGDADTYCDIVYVVETGQHEDGKYYIALSGKGNIFNVGDPLDGAAANNRIIKINSALNQEIGNMKPTFLKGYVYESAAPKSPSMYDKLEWQKLILSVLTDYKGIRTGLLNKADIDYRYIVDTFESYVDSSCKNVLSYLAKEKQSAFAFINFPSVKTFINCPYTSFTDGNGVFNVQYVVDGYNKKKASSKRFSLPSDADGASFCGFYTPVKVQDTIGTTIIPSAAIVSNLFMQKYLSRQPYYIVAGPNYGNVTAQGAVGPDYNYSMDELQIIEPYGVNCMVYRPNFGTFINANQTAKQTPKSALSSVNVRELVIYVQDEVEKILQRYQWEFNNSVTRNAILDKVNYICSMVQANGGIQKYLAIMDESNNTPDIIDNEMAVLSLHIEPGRGCGKMIQELTLYRTGGMSSAITE